MEVLMAMKFELMLTGIIFILLILKIDGRASNGFVLNLVNFLLVLNLGLGFFGNGSIHVFGEMFRTSPLLVIEKSVLNLAVLLISLFSAAWLKNHKHMPEFFMLLF